MYKLLIIGNAIDKHIERLICRLKQYNVDAQIDLLTFLKEDPSRALMECVNNFYFVNHKKLKAISRIEHLITTVNRLSIDNHYDVINIHFPTYEFSFIVNRLKKMTNCLLLTPWGSDVYRISTPKRFILKYLYKRTDYVSGLDNRFLNDVKQIYSIPDGKTIELSMASETIDFIYSHKDETKKNDAKHLLELNENNYVITCGYNGGKGQNHLTIIDSIISIKEKLPKNTILLFPMTYGLKQDYFNEIKNKIKNGGLNAIYYTEFLDLQNFFYVIMATDIFIHLQQTDNNSATLKEFILGDAKVINGSWLKYDDLNVNNNSPIWEIDDINQVGNKIIEILNMATIPIEKKIEDNIIKMGYNYWIPRWDNFFMKQSNNTDRLG